MIMSLLLKVAIQHTSTFKHNREWISKYFFSLPSNLAMLEANGLL